MDHCEVYIISTGKKRQVWKWKPRHGDWGPNQGCCLLPTLLFLFVLVQNNINSKKWMKVKQSDCTWLQRWQEGFKLAILCKNVLTGLENGTHLGASHSMLWSGHQKRDCGWPADVPWDSRQVGPTHCQGPTCWWSTHLSVAWLQWQTSSSKTWLFCYQEQLLCWALPCLWGG